MADEDQKTIVSGRASKMIPQQQHRKPPSLGEAAGITLLLSDHSRFGSKDRVYYHFDLVGTLCIDEERPRSVVSRGGDGQGGATKILKTREVFGEEENQLLSEPHRPPCGVVNLLECVPQIPLNKQTKRHRRLLRNKVREFNLQTRLIRGSTAGKKDGNRLWCYQPQSLPLRPLLTTRLAFAYDLTSIVLCVDASTSMTSTFGNMGSYREDDAICAIDRLGGMVKTLFRALVEPIYGASYSTEDDGFGGSSNGSAAGAKWWRPELAVTVIAVYPYSKDVDNETSSVGTNFLVRDFRVTDSQSASLLSNMVTEWSMTEVENEIASSIRPLSYNPYSGVSKTMCHEDQTATLSSLHDILEVCELARSTLPPEGRPCIVLATDCRSVMCDSVIDAVTDMDQSDVPLHVLDLSAQHSHCLDGKKGVIDCGDPADQNQPLFLTIDEDGPSTFPLDLSDDSEAVHDICKATGGAFFNGSSLNEAAKTLAGQVPPSSPLHLDYYFAFKRRTIRPNALQWCVYYVFQTKLYFVET